jgi:hypothetical protein
MPDFLSMVERGLKAVRFGIFQASDNLAMLLDGLCRAPEEPQEYAEFCYGTVPLYDSTPWPPDSAAASPAAAVVAPSPKQGSDSPPRDSAIPPGALGGHPNPYQQKDDSFLLNAAADIVEAWVPLVVSGSPGTVWVDQFLHALRDRAAQFAGLEDTYQPDK